MINAKYQILDLIKPDRQSKFVDLWIPMSILGLTFGFAAIANGFSGITRGLSLLVSMDATLRLLKAKFGDDIEKEIESRLARDASE